MYGAPAPEPLSVAAHDFRETILRHLHGFCVSQSRSDFDLAENLPFEGAAFIAVMLDFAT